MSFGKFLKNHRLEADLTQEEAAKAAGLTRAMWAKLEADESGTRRNNIPNIAAAIRAPLNETYRQAGFDPGDKADINDRLARRLSPILLRLPPERRAKAEDAITQMAELLVSNAA